jgi:hypothetical protein
MMTVTLGNVKQDKYAQGIEALEENFDELLFKQLAANCLVMASLTLFLLPLWEIGCQGTAGSTSYKYSSYNGICSQY